MAQKSAVTKQQDSSRARAGGNAGEEAFGGALAQCVQNAEPEAVHRVRTGSRRLQAMVEATLRENGSPALQQPAKAWLRQLKQVRRAAAPVRDLDVHRELLEQWVGKESPASGLFTQAEQLDAWLKGKRRRLAQKMQKQLRKRQHTLEARQATFKSAEQAAPLGVARVPRSAETVALESFVRAADAMPTLDAENLHDFRKAIKKARYVAESGAEGQTPSSVAKALKRIQDAIGNWHDWLCLEDEARAALKDDAPELTAFLQQEVERNFALALQTTQTLRGRLLGEWLTSQGKRPMAVPSIGGRRLA